jgi:hypothetical protein
MAERYFGRRGRVFSGRREEHGGWWNLGAGNVARTGTRVRLCAASGDPYVRDMSDELASQVDVEFDVEPSFVLELDADWLAYLEAEDPPSLVAGIDPNMTYLPESGAGDGGTAYA